MPGTGNVERDRFVQVIVLPALFGVAVATFLGLPLGILCRMAADGILNQQVMARAAENRDYYGLVVDQVEWSLSVLVTVVTLLGWASAVGWFARCWRTRVAQVGTVQRGRAAWLSIGVGGLLASYAAASYLLWGTPFGSPSSFPSLSLITYNAVRASVGFVGLYYCCTYWVISVFCTHEVYVPSIPWSTWRT